VLREQAEHPRCGGAELLAGPGEHGPDAGGRVARIEGVEPAGGVPQFGGQRGERQAGTGGGAGGGYRQCQREASAQAGYIGDRVRLGSGAVAIQPGGEHLPGLGGGGHVQGEQAGAVGGG
jgi:hypothetical protein